MPVDITAGPDGNLWFTDTTPPSPMSVDNIGRITTSGTITEFPLPTACTPPAPPPTLCPRTPTGITAGPDGNLWFIEQTANNIGRITTSGTITEFPIPTVGSVPIDITAGPDGNLWFTEASAFVSKIGRITTAGVIINEFPTPTTGSAPLDITAGPPARIGTVWFTEVAANNIGKITT